MVMMVVVMNQPSLEMAACHSLPFLFPWPVTRGIGLTYDVLFLVFFSDGCQPIHPPL